MGNGEWGMGNGNWGLVIGYWGLGIGVGGMSIGRNKKCARPNGQARCIMYSRIDC